MAVAADIVELFDTLPPFGDLPARVGDVRAAPAVLSDDGRGWDIDEHAAPGEVPSLPIVLALDRAGEPIDLVAYHWRSRRLATLYGRAAVLGLDALAWPRLDLPQIRVFRSFVGWLAAGRHGLIILDETRAAGELQGEELLGEDREHGELLQRTLTIRPAVFFPNRAAA